MADGRPRDAIKQKRLFPETTGALLYHVTRPENAELIKRNGFQPGFYCAEGGEAHCAAQAILAGEEEPDLDWGGETPEEVQAREIFNEILDANKPKGRPGHDYAVFFWSHPDEAEIHERAMEERTGEPYVTLKVDASKVPCTCYEAPVHKVETLFDEIYSELPRSWECAPSGGGPQDEETEKFCEMLDRLARSYYRQMRVYRGDARRGVEVLCPCEVPPDAIVGQTD